MSVNDVPGIFDGRASAEASYAGVTEEAGVFDALRLRVWLWALERPFKARDRIPLALFLGSFSVYWLIGQAINEFHGDDVFDRFFNADCPRVVSDITRAHREWSSGFSNASAHPLFVLLLNPIGMVVSRFLGRSDLMATLLLNHAAAAFAVTTLYWILRRLSVDRWLATTAAIAYALSTTELVFGSVPETYSFSAAALLSAVLVSLSNAGPLGNTFAHLLALGTNTALGVHSLLSAPLLWLGRFGWRRWALRVAVFWLAIAALTAGLIAVEDARYPERSFVHQSLGPSYRPYAGVPSAADAPKRAVVLAPHLVLFNVVAPAPLYTPRPNEIVTFMGVGPKRMAWYKPFAGAVACLWVVVFAVGVWGNIRSFRAAGVLRRSVALLCAGWLFGCFLLFMIYGDDFLLYSELWTPHLVIGAALGIDHYVGRMKESVRRGSSLVFLALLAAANADFVVGVLRHFESSSLLSF